MKKIAILLLTMFSLQAVFTEQMTILRGIILGSYNKRSALYHILNDKQKSHPRICPMKKPLAFMHVGKKLFDIKFNPSIKLMAQSKPKESSSHRICCGNGCRRCVAMIDGE